VQSRHQVRYLRRTSGAAGLVGGLPIDFPGHALYYSLYPDHLRATVLERAQQTSPGEPGVHEGWQTLSERLGTQRPVLFRVLTPPGLSIAKEDWLVLRILVPGLQPLHGHHSYPFLGGPLWGSRPISEYSKVPPHPFP
jgi:hypothetical protein